MSATGYKYKKIIAGMIFFISLLLSDRLSAQMAFHLAGPFVYKENLKQELKLIEKSKKIFKSDKIASLKNSERGHSNKESLESGVIVQDIKNEGMKNIADELVNCDTVQRIHPGQLKRSFSGNNRKAIN